MVLFNKNNIIEVYWGWYCKDKGEEEIIVTYKPYYDEVGLAEAPNGENGIVTQYDDEEYNNEPYNFYSEIMDAFSEFGVCEVSEANYKLFGNDIIDVIAKMRAKGFELIYNENLDITI